MSEVISGELQVTVEAEYDAAVLTNFDTKLAAKEEKNNDWGHELTALVAANADIIVRCSWMGGAEVTLADAMTYYNYPPNLTAEDEPFLISVVMDLLASRVIETEEQDEEEEPEAEEEPDKKTRIKEETVKEEKTKPKNNTDVKTRAENRKPDIQNMDRPGKTVETPAGQKSDRAIAERPPDTANGEPAASQTETPVKFDVEPQAGREIQSVIEVGTVPPPSKQSPVIINEASPVPPAPAETAASEVFEDIVAAGRLETKDAAPNAKDPETASEVQSETEVLYISEDMSASTKEAIDPEQAEPEYAPQVLEELSETRVLAAFTEDEKIVIDHLEEPGPEPELEADPLAMLIETSEESTVVLEASARRAEVPAEISLNTEEVEEPLLELAEKLKAGAPEDIEIATEILKNIVELPVKLEAIDSRFSEADEAMVKEMIQEETADLLAELFEQMGVEYTPEIIESLARLTFVRNLHEELEGLRPGHQTDETPQGYGTHEIISQPLIGISAVQKALAYSYAIGQSAIRLCNLSLAKNT